MLNKGEKSESNAAFVLQNKKKLRLRCCLFFCLSLVNLFAAFLDFVCGLVVMIVCACVYFDAIGALSFVWVFFILNTAKSR